MSQPTAPSASLIKTVNDLMHTGFEIDLAKLVPEASLKDDLGLDSLDAVDMLVYIEEKMGVRIEGERLKTVKTLGDVYVLAAESEERLNAQGNSGQ